MRMKKVRQMKEHMKDMNMKRLFRRNQIIITTLAVMIAAAGYLNYAGQKDMAAGNIYEAGAMDISDEDILAENQAASGGLEDIPSLDQDLSQLEGQELALTDGEKGREPAPTEGAEGREPVQTDAKEGQELAQTDAKEGQELASTEGAKTQEPSSSGEGRENQAAGEEELALGESGASETGLENPGEAVLTSGMSVADYIANVQLTREQVRAKNKETLMGLINSTSIDEAAKQQAIQEMISLTDISEKENAAETLLMAKGFSDPVVSISDEKVDVVINASSITDPQRAQIEDIVKRKAEVGADQIIITLLNMTE